MSSIQEQRCFALLLLQTKLCSITNLLFSCNNTYTMISDTGTAPVCAISTNWGSFPRAGASSVLCIFRYGAQIQVIPDFGGAAVLRRTYRPPWYSRELRRNGKISTVLWNVVIVMAIQAFLNSINISGYKPVPLIECPAWWHLLLLRCAFSFQVYCPVKTI